MLGSAVVEHLTTMTGARLCAWADGQGMAVLPHYSPGYPGWDIAEQPRLLGLFQGAGTLPGNLEALESGALRPKKSLLAVFGLTRKTEGVRRLTEVVACENCSLAACQYRRDDRETMKERLQDVIRRRPLLGDGAMGTQLMLAGLEQGNCGEAWNLTHPERVLAIQRRYAEAGSDCILTNTFGGSRIMLNRHRQRGQGGGDQPGRRWRLRARRSAGARAT